MKNKENKVMTIEGQEVQLAYPSIGLSSEADLEYSKAFTNALKNGILPRVIMEKTLRDSSVWSNEDDEKITDLSKLLQATMVEAATTVDKAAREKKKEVFYETQNELFTLTMKKESLAKHTAEEKGSEARMAFLSWNCILSKDGSKLWPSKEVFFQEQNNSFIKKVIAEFASYTSGLEEQMNSIDAILSGDLVKSVESDQKEPETAEVKEKEVEPAAP